MSTVFRTDLMVNGKTNDMVFFMIKEKMHYECDASTGANHVMTIIGNLVHSIHIKTQLTFFATKTNRLGKRLLDHQSK